MGHAVRHLRDAADPFISNLKRRVYPTLELDYNKLLDMVSEMGYRLMKSGAEIYRVEESIQRLLQAYGAPRGEVFAIPNCLMVSLTSPDGRPVTQIRRMPTHGTDIYLLEKYNGLCRRLCRETPAFEEALEQMGAIPAPTGSTPCPPNWLPTSWAGACSPCSTAEPRPTGCAEGCAAWSSAFVWR